MKLKAVFVVFITFLMLLSFASVFFVSTVKAQSYDYYMNISGSNYQILDSGHSVKHFSQSSSTAFNWLLGFGGIATDSSTVYVESGNYLVDLTWVIAKNNVVVNFASTLPSTPNLMGNLVGSGTPGAVLTAIANLNNNMMVIYANNVIITGLTEDGNAANQYHGWNHEPEHLIYGSMGGLYIEGNNNLVQYSTIHDCRSWGIGLNGDNCGVQNCKIYRIGANAITSSSWTVVHSGMYFINNEIYACSDVGIASQTQNTVITGNYVHDIDYMGQTGGDVNSFWGIAWESNLLEHAGGSGNGVYALCAGNIVDNVASTGIIISAEGVISNVWISGNTVSNCRGNYYGGIEVYGSNNIASYNTVTNSYIGLHIGGGDMVATNINVYGNSLNGNTYNYIDHGSGTTQNYTPPPAGGGGVGSTPTPTPTPTGGGVGVGGGTPTPTPNPTVTPTPSSTNITSDWSKDPIFLGGFGFVSGVSSLPLVGLVAPVGRILKRNPLHRIFSHRRAYRRHRRYRRH